MFDLEAISCVHLRLHDALLRIARVQMWGIIPVAVGVFAVMAWWAEPAGTSPAAPAAVLACLLMLAAKFTYALITGHDAGLAARELSAFHNQVMEAAESEEEDHATHNS